MQYAQTNQNNFEQELREIQLQQLSLEREIAGRYALDSLSHYIKLMWSAIEPNTPYQHNWHIDAMSEHLEAVFKNQLKNLIIMVPPGHMKSLETGVFFPSWVWLKRPEKRWIFTAYSQSLTIRDSIKCRSLIESQTYQEIFRPKWRLSDDQNQKIKFNNTETGYRIASSVGGTGTGERAHFIVADDPLNAINAHSDLERQNVIDYWDQSMSSRDADPSDTHRIIIMQRLHEDDLAGHCARQKDYEVLRLPAEYEPAKKCKTSIGWEDPRTQVGEPLFPQRFTKEFQKNQKEKLGSLGYSAQQQQDPKPREGGLFKSHWWKSLEVTPEINEIVQFWDCAQKPGITNDYSVCATWAKTNSGYALLDLWREKVEAPTLEAMAKALYEKWKPVAVVIEDKSAGQSLIQYLLRSTTLPVIPYNPGQRDKEVRATAATPTVEAGKCFLPKSATWLDDFKSEHEKFPRGSHDDMVDTTSMMVDYFSRRASSQPRIRTL